MAVLGNGMPNGESSSEFGTTQVPERASLLHFDAGERLIVPGEFALTDAAFSRQGHDLLLEDANGQRILIQEYFAHSEPPALATEGGVVLPPDLVRALAGPMAPGQYAQAGERWRRRSAR